MPASSARHDGVYFALWPSALAPSPAESLLIWSPATTPSSISISTSWSASSRRAALGVIEHGVAILGRGSPTGAHRHPPRITTADSRRSLRSARVPLVDPWTTRSADAASTVKNSQGGQFFVSPGGQFRMSFDNGGQGGRLYPPSGRRYRRFLARAPRRKRHARTEPTAENRPQRPVPVRLRAQIQTLLRALIGFLPAFGRHLRAPGRACRSFFAFRSPPPSLPPSLRAWLKMKSVFTTGYRHPRESGRKRGSRALA